MQTNNTATLPDFEKDLLIKGAVDAGVQRIYYKDFRYRVFDEKAEHGLLNLDEYLDYFAKNEVVIISHGMGNGADYLINFLRKTYLTNNKHQFKFTLVLPQSYSYADLALRESNEKDYDNNIDYIEKKLLALKEEIKQKSSIDVAINIRYTNDIIFGSTILIDDLHIQTETKYAGVPEDYNLVFGLHKTNDENNYYNQQLLGIKKIIDGSVDKKSLSNRPLFISLRNLFTILLGLSAIIISVLALICKININTASILMAVISIIISVINSVGKNLRDSLKNIFTWCVKKLNKK